MARKPKSATRAPETPFTEPWPGPSKMMRIDTIVPYEKNTRTHPQKQIDLLASMLKRWGPDQPIVVDEHNVILKGHGRRLAAIAAGFEQFPVVKRTGLPEDEKRALRIADNQVALLAGWDTELMRYEVTSLQQDSYDVGLLAFSEAQLRGFGITAGDQKADPNDVPTSPKKPVVRVGDIWTLGKHRIACGDATQPEVWKKLFGRERASMVFTDPPYGVSYEAPSGAFKVIEGDKKRRDDLYKMLHQSIRELAKHATDTAAFYIWHASSTREDFAQAMKAAGLTERQYLLWVKPAIVFGRADYQWQHEPCFYAAKGDRKPAFYADRAESTVWHVQLASAKETAATVGNGILLLDGEGGSLYVQARAPKNKKLRQVRLMKDTTVFLSGSENQTGTVWEVARDGNHEHPTQKPVELARRAIENSSRPGEIIADAFLGSGTTLIGAEMTGRRCFGTELDPAYAEVSIRRWEKVSGQAALLNGKTLAEVAKARQRGLPKGTGQTKSGAARAAPLPASSSAH